MVPGPASGASREDAAALGQQLRADRDQTAARIAELRRQFDAIVESAALAVPDDEHDPEGSTIGFERAQVSALINQAQSHLKELESALARLRDGSYGRCERCGHGIGDERLQARPAARTCIQCAAGPRGSRPSPRRR
jgi:RNA polymerase-binding transcription factor DksA